MRACRVSVKSYGKRVALMRARTHGTYQRRRLVLARALVAPRLPLPRAWAASANSYRGERVALMRAPTYGTDLRQNPVFARASAGYPRTSSTPPTILSIPCQKHFGLSVQAPPRLPHCHPPTPALSTQAHPQHASVHLRPNILNHIACPRPPTVRALPRYTSPRPPLLLRCTPCGPGPLQRTPPRHQQQFHYLIQPPNYAPSLVLPQSRATQPTPLTFKPPPPPRSPLPRHTLQYRPVHPTHAWSPTQRPRTPHTSPYLTHPSVTPSPPTTHRSQFFPPSNFAGKRRQNLHTFSPLSSRRMPRPPCRRRRALVMEDTDAPMRDAPKVPPHRPTVNPSR